MGTAEPRNRGLKFRLLRKLARITRWWHPRGTDWLLRRLYSPDRRQTDHIALAVDYGPDLLIHVDTASFIEWSIFFYGQYEPEVADLVRRILQPGAVAVDVGANIGCHTLVMARSVGSQGRVLAVEPNPAVRERLAANVALNRLANVEVLSCGLSDEAGEATFYVPPEGFPNQGLGSLCPDPTLSNEVTVEVQTFDAIADARGMERLDLVKVDAQGMDLKVLLGARRSIEACHPHLLFEYDAGEWEKAGVSFAECRTFLADAGYTLHALYDVGCLRPIGQDAPASANVLAVPESVV
jgi:FkbM family methyltransferase